jgi:arsenite methyltransferase
VTAPADIKACCVAAYGSDAVAALLGDTYHPGGLTLTRRLAGHLALRPGARILDVAAGRGTTPLLLAAEYRARVDGIDLSPANATQAAQAAQAAGLATQATFTVGDAERLPYRTGAFDAVVCECAWCTFPDQAAAAAELARVLRPGGRLGVTDVTADPGRLPDELASVAAWIACVAGARPVDGYARLLTTAGLRVVHTERHDDAAARMIEQIEARLTLLSFSTPRHPAHRWITARDRARALGLDPDRIRPVLAAAAAAIADGAIGYALLVAEKPA